MASGICERVHKTLLDEVCRVAFRERICESPEALQADLDAWMAAYTEGRSHQGRRCFGTTPIQMFRNSRAMAREKQSIGEAA